MGGIFTSPSRYIQGNGELQNLGKYVAKLGSSALCVISRGGFGRSGEEIRDSFKGQAEVSFEIFEGECSHREIERIRSIAEDKGADVIVGIGGGKAIDTAKAAAFKLGVPVVICPTIASSDAPCSAVSVVYSEAGAVEDVIFMPTNPDFVVVDSGVIAKSPRRMTAAGMGDAMATFFEARACIETGSDNCVGGGVTTLAAGIARLCYETLMSDGLAALEDIDQGICSEHVEKVIEANTLLSGLGFESGGLSCAHAVHNGLTVLEETHHMQHGEKVNFGTLVQLVIEKDQEYLDKVLPWMVKAGLPVTLEQLGITDTSKEHLQRVTEAVCEDAMIRHMKVKADPDLIYDAFLAADAVGREALETK